MSTRRLFAWWVYIALTTPIGLLAHFAFEAYGRRDGAFSPFEADHLLLMAAIVCLIGAVTFALRRGSRDERRLRLAQLRASIPRGAALVAVTCTVQLGVASGTLALEGPAIDPARFACALLLGIAAAVLGASAFSHIEDSVLTVAAALETLHFNDAAAVRVAIWFATAVPTYRIAVGRHDGRAPPFRYVTLSN